MGKSVFKNGFLQDSDIGQHQLLNSPQVQLALRALGEEFIAVAKTIFIASSKREDRLPTLYLDSFGIREVHHLLVEAIEIYNDDPTAEWVEFGSHAHGETKVLRYRVFGRTADIMEAKASERT